MSVVPSESVCRSIQIQIFDSNTTLQYKRQLSYARQLDKTVREAAIWQIQWVYSSPTLESFKFHDIAQGSENMKLMTFGRHIAELAKRLLQLS